MGGQGKALGLGVEVLSGRRFWGLELSEQRAPGNG